MQNFVAPGDTIQCSSAPYAVTPGQGLQWGTQFGIACGTAAISTPVQAKVVGVFDVTALGTEAWTEGIAIYWDNANRRLTATAGAHIKVGHAVTIKANSAGATIGRVRLTGAAA